MRTSAEASLSPSSPSRAGAAPESPQSLNHETAPGQPEERLSCAICGTALLARFAVRGYRVAECGQCGHRCLEHVPGPDHVERVFSDEYFFGGGAGYADYLSEAALLREHGRWYGRLLARYTAPGRLLDVGTGAGFVLEGFIDQGWQGRGLEPNLRMGALAAKRLGPIVEAGALEEWSGNDEFDLVAMIQVIAHLCDLGRAMETAARATKTGGFWLVETWDRASWTARVFGRRWHEMSPPSVLRWFTPNEVALLGRRHGFRERGRGRPPKWLDARHARSLLAHTGGLVGGLGRGLLALVPDRLRLPYLGDDLFWMLLQKVA